MSQLFTTRRRRLGVQLGLLGVLGLVVLGSLMGGRAQAGCPAGYEDRCGPQVKINNPTTVPSQCLASVRCRIRFALSVPQSGGGGGGDDEGDDGFFGGGGGGLKGSGQKYAYTIQVVRRGRKPKVVASTPKPVQTSLGTVTWKKKLLLAAGTYTTTISVVSGRTPVTRSFTFKVRRRK